MLKIIGFELKKLVSRIGIYILVLLMAGLLVAGVFMYKPTERTIAPYKLAGDTVTEMYNSFKNDLQQGYVDNLNTISTDAKTYVSGYDEYNSSNSQEYINQLFTAFDDNCLLYSEQDLPANEYLILLEGIKISLTELKNALDVGLSPTKNQTGYYILTSTSNYTELYSLLNKISENFKSPIVHADTGRDYVNLLRAPLYNCIQNLTYPKLNDNASKYIEGGTYYALITSRMDEIESKMDVEYTKAVENPNLESDSTIKNELNVLFNRYVNCAQIFEQSYNSSMCVEALSSVTNKTERSNLLSYGNISLYEQEAIASQYRYYIENHYSPADFANGLSVSHTSNGKINAYDFTFFIMSLFTVLVIIFAIYLSAHTISGEINNNTMRFTAIRPIKRSSVFLGKYFAITIISIILLLFGTITSMIVGGIMYGIDSANILVIFNSDIVFNVHPMIVLAIFVLSQLLIIMVYSSLTILLSTILKSDLLSMLCGVVVYAVTLILPLFFGTTSWLKFLPLTNINLFAYFGTTSITSDSVLAKIFNPTVYYGMSIWISIIYVIGITKQLLLIGKQIFKKLEL